MLVCRDEPWGRVVFDPDSDEFWAELWAGAEDPRIDRILSATFDLKGMPQTGQQRRAVTEHWIGILDRLVVAGLMRLSLVGLAEIQRAHALQIVRAAFSRGIGVTVSLQDCLPELERFPGFPLGMGLRVVLDPARVLRTAIFGGPSLARRVELIQQCVEKELRVRVITPYEPFCPLTLAEVGEKLAVAGVRDWQIQIPGPAMLHEPWHASAGLEEVRQLRSFFPWMEISCRIPRNREQELVVEASGTVRALESEEPRRLLSGSVAALVVGDLLTEAFFDRHAGLWLGWTSPGDPPALAAEPLPGLVRREVFLSYNHQDRELAAAFRDHLRSAGIYVWMDTEDLRAGDPWLEVVGTALERCRAVVFCIGPSGIGSFHRREMNIALANDVIVVPVLLPGANLADVPSMLRPFQYSDCRTSFEKPVSRLVSALWRDVIEAEDEDFPEAAAKRAG